MSSTINASTASGGGVITSADASGVLALQTGGTTAVTIDASQNVGIGTSSSLAKLGVGGADSAFIFGVSGTTNGLRVSVDSIQTSIQGVDRSLSASYQPLTLGGSTLTFQTNGVTTQASITATGLFQFNSGYGSAATAYGCRAWVNFNGTGTVAIRASGNVSSITDNGVGDYTVNFTTAMPDANYSVTLSTVGATISNVSQSFLIAGVAATGAALKSTTQVRVQTGSSNTGALTDQADNNAAIFR